MFSKILAAGPAGAKAPSGYNGASHTVDISTAVTFIQPGNIIVINANSAIDLRSTIAYHLWHHGGRPAENAAPADLLKPTVEIMQAAAKRIGIDIVLHTLFAMLSAAGVSMAFRSADVLTHREFSAVLGVHQEVALNWSDSLWAHLVREPSQMAKITDKAPMIALAIGANYLSRTTCDGHNWLTADGNVNGTPTNRALGVCGSKKDVFPVFMHEFGHDIAHMLTDASLAEAAFAMSGHTLKRIKGKTEAQYQAAITEDDAQRGNAPGAPPMLRDVPDMPDLDDTTAGVVKSTASGLGEALRMASSSSGGAKAEDYDDEDDEGDGDGDGSGDDPEEPMGLPPSPFDPNEPFYFYAGKNVHGQIVSDVLKMPDSFVQRIPAGNMGIAAIMVGLSCLASMMQDIASKMVVEQSRQMINFSTGLKAGLSAKRMSSNDIKALRDILSPVLSVAVGYCMEVTTLEKLGRSSEALTAVNNRHPVESSAGATMAKRLKEVDMDPAALSAFILNTFNMMGAAMNRVNRKYMVGTINVDVAPAMVAHVPYTKSQIEAIELRETANDTRRAAGKAEL